MTIIELLVATMLASLLMAAVLGVLRGVSRQEKKLIADGGTPTWRDRAVRAIELDLKNATSFKRVPGGCELTGHFSHGSQDPTFDAQASVRRFQLQQIGSASCLLRTDQSVLDPSRSQTELLCRGVNEFMVSPLAQSDKAKSSASWLSDGVLPPTMQVTLRMDGDSPDGGRHAIFR